ncbi:hypothetical protein QZH41_001420 [Actinostola sp. cb2023]|nr:hypothetical protein QZH41_001420 [Actinostola sp. cb2023]
MAATDKDREEPLADENTANTEELSTSKSIMVLLKSMQENILSSNNLLRDLVHGEKRRPLETEHETTTNSKRRKLDARASEKAKTNTSEEVDTYTSEEVDQNASDKANNSASEKEKYNRKDNEDVLSLFGEDSESEKSSDDENLLSDITMSLSSSDDTGPPVSDKLAKLINEKFDTEYTVEKSKEIIQKYKKPSNCETLYVPKVNQEIWGKLPTYARRTDIRMSVLQDTLIKVSSAIICSIDDLLNHREKKTTPNYKNLIPQLTYSVALLGHVNKEFSFKRRDAVRPFLNQDFKQACSRNHKPGKLLFGDDLPKTLQELKTTNKIMSNVSDTYKGNHRTRGQYNSQYNNNYRGNNFRGNQSKPFWGYRGRNAYPPRSNYQQNQTQNKRKFTKN